MVACFCDAAGWYAAPAHRERGVALDHMLDHMAEGTWLKATGPAGRSRAAAARVTGLGQCAPATSVRGGFSARCVVRPGADVVSSARTLLRCMRSRRSRSAVVRVRAALAAAVFLVASLLGILHEATTTHVRCTAHGELVDSHTPVGAASEPVRDTILHGQPTAHGHGDEHCLLASALRSSRIAPRAPALVGAVAASVGDVEVIAPRAAPAPACLYRVAPKTSPPA